MHKGRLEAFSDAVIAIILTVMVLELRPPHDPTIESLRLLAPQFLSYILSFIFLGIYWNNHHHMLQTASRVNGAVLWANMHLLFWLSMVPFVTAWMGEHPLASFPTFSYGVVLLASGISYTILQATLVKANGKNSKLGEGVGSDLKGKLSVGAYVVAIATAMYAPEVSCVLFALVALMWLVPDPRLEKQFENEPIDN